VFNFVLCRPDRPLREDEQWIGTDSLPTRCPSSSNKLHVVVCGEAVPTVVKVVF
jgi:hypothetical protein